MKPVELTQFRVPWLVSPAAVRATLFLLLATTAVRGADAPEGKPVSLTAERHARKTIYHSPQKPGFTSWVGAWAMPDGSLMVSFTQATGPLKDRPRAPKAVQEKLSWPP